MKKEKNYYCIGIRKKVRIKEADETELSKKLSSNAYTLVGEDAVLIFDNKTECKEYLKSAKEEMNDKNIVFKILDYGTEMPKINPSKLYSKT